MRNRIKNGLGRICAIGTLLVSGAISAQSLELVESAHELTLTDVTLPSSTSGTLIFRSCAQCDPVALPVNSATTYYSARHAMPLADFNLWVNELRGSPGANATFVTVYRDSSNGRVTRIQVHARD